MDENNGQEYFESSEQGLTPIVRGLLIANVLIYLLFLFLDFGFGPRYGAFSYQQLSELFGLVPMKALEDLWLWQFVTYAFVHDKGLPHILFNMFALWWFGTEVERVLQRRAFLQLYFFAAIASVFVHLPFAYLTNAKATPVIGASGAIMAVLVVFAGLFPERKIYLLVLGPFSARVLVIIMMLVDLTWLMNQPNRVAAAVHLGGAVFGFAYLALRTRVGRFFSELERRMETEERSAQASLRLDLDNVLRKINETGMASLTRDEKAILDRASKHYRDHPS